MLMRNFGQSGCVTLAACLNTVVGATAFLSGRSNPSQARPSGGNGAGEGRGAGNLLGLRWAAALAAVAGLLALGFEIAWFRIFALATFDRAPAFALLLATYLAGIAAGSFVSETMVRKRGWNPVTLAGGATVAAGTLSVYLPPLMADSSWHNIPVLAGAPAFFLTTALLGSVLPLLC